MRELRRFREAVETYFERSERDVNDVPMDWQGAQAARSRIDQMLPRIVEVLQRIFSARLGDGLDQEIFDVLDTAVGVPLETCGPQAGMPAAIATSARRHSRGRRADDIRWSSWYRGPAV